MTTQEELDKVRSAIANVLDTGERFKTPDGLEVQNSLAELRNRERELMTRLENETDGSTHTPLAFRRPC